MDKQKSQKTKKKFRFPNSFLIIIGLMLFFILISWILHWSGVHYKDAKGNTSQIVGLGILDVFPAIWNGFRAKVGVIIFVFALGGILMVMERSKILDASIAKLTTKMKGKEIILIPILMLIFGLGGTTYGMWEETIAFFPVLIPAFIKAKYDGLTGVFVILLGAGVGCLASTINPFAIGLAFQSAGSMFKSGTHLGLRWLIWIIFMIPTISFVMWYAQRVRKSNGEKSFLTINNNNLIKKTFVSETEPPAFNGRRKASLILFLSGFVVMILSYLPWSQFLSKSALLSFNTFMHKYFYWLASSNLNDPSLSIWAAWGEWAFLSIAGLFLMITIIIAIINRKDYGIMKGDTDNAEHKDQKFLNIYFSGITMMIPVCILIAVASGLGLILTSSGIGVLIANSARSLGHTGLIGFAIIIFLLSLIISILVPSTSGFAAAFIPIFAQIAIKAFPGTQVSAVNIVIIAFVLSSGLANLFTPTAAPLMAYTQFSKIKYIDWLKSTWVFISILFVLSLLIMILCGAIIEHISF